MKKRILSIVLSIVMLVSLLPTTALALETPSHAHDMSVSCGGSGVTFEEWNNATSLPTSGNYYLNTDVTLTAKASITGELNLCLNGHTITANYSNQTIYVSAGALNLCDCNTATCKGYIDSSTDSWMALEGDSNVPDGAVELDLTGGYIQGKISASGAFNMYGGNIVNSNGVGVSVSENFIFNMYGGTIAGHQSDGVQVGDGSTVGTFNMYDGTIYNKGRGIYNYNANGVVTVSDGTVSSTTKHGIYNNGSGSITVSGGTITGAKNGIYNFGGTVTVSGGTVSSTNGYGIFNNVTLKLSGAPEIEGTTADVYLSKNEIIDITGALSYAPENAISVEMHTPGTFTSGWNSNMSGKTPGNYFTSAMDGYTVQPDGSGELKLAEPSAVETHSHDMSVACGNEAPVTYTAWDGMSTPSGSVYLTKDVTLADTLTISSGTVNMCLNGHNITNSSAAIEVKSGATLNICDCGSGGTVSATASGSRGIENYGILTVYGGTVSGNTYGICNNYGGNVAVSGGTVSGGTGIENYGTLTVSGGSVTGTHTYGGYGISTYGTFKLSGAPAITGGSNSADVLIHAYQKVITIDGTLTYSTPISVKPYNGYSAFTEGWNEKMPDAAHNDYFVPASGSYVFVESSDELKPAYTVTYDANDAASGSVPVDSSSPYFYSNVVTVLDNTGGLAKEGYEFSGWNTKADGTGTHYAPDSTFTIYSNTTLYAVWKVPHIHEYTYAVNGENAAQVIESCTCGHSETATLEIDTSVSTVYNGSAIKALKVSYSDGWVGDKNAEISYTNNTNAGTASGSITIGNATAIKSFSITKKAAVAPAMPSAPEAVTYGTKLSEVGLTDGWTWANGNTVPTVNNSGYTAYYTPNDTANFDWAAIEGWNASAGRVERTVAVTVNKSAPTYTAPTGLTATYGDTLANVSLPSGWTWKTPSASVGNAGVNSFKAVFTPDDTDNYDTVEIDVIVTVGKADASYTTPTGLTATYGDTLEDVSLPSGWTWKTPSASVGNVGINSFKAVYTPSDTDNFNAAEVDVSVTVNAKQLTNPTLTLDVSSFTYDGSAKTPTVIVKDGDTVLTEGTDYTVSYSDNTNAGTGKVTVIFTGNYSGSAEKSFTISKATPVLGTVSVSGTVKDTTSPAAVVLTKTAGPKGTFVITDAAMLANKAVYSYTFTPDDTTNYNTVTGTVQIDVKDTQVPSATIKVDTKEWKEKLNGITFGIFFKNSQTVTITYADNENGSGLKDKLYYAADKELSEAELAAVEWKNYGTAFNIDPDGKFVIYAKVTDNDGNNSIVNSNGIVLDETQAVIEGITNGGTYYGNVTITVSDALAGVREVKVDNAGVTLTDGTYTIVADNAQHTVTVTDKAGNVTEYKITVYKNYTVTFMVDGKVVATKTVGHGKDAEAPAIPEKEGYTQTAPEWDGDGTNITADTVINAVYTINTYTVTYVIDGEVVDTQTVEHGTKIAEPTAPTKDKVNFAGWFSDSACTKAWNFAKDTVTADLTLYAKWSDVPVFHISGKVLEKTGDGENEKVTVSGATVELKLGTTLIATETTDENGLFYFGGQKAGDYNVVVTSGAKVVTVLVTLHDRDEDGLTVELPKTVTNSIVEHEPAADGKDSVAAGTLVGGLEDVAATVRGENQSAQKVEVKLTVKDTPPVTGTPTAGTEAAKQQAQQKAIQQKAGGKQLVFFDLSVVKTINGGAPVAITDTGATLLEIRIPFDSGNKWGITIYRYHGDKAEALAAVREGSTTEGFWVGDDGYIHIYTHKFSTYAVGYTVPSYGYFVPVTPDTVTSADTFDTGIVVYVTMSMLAATGSAVVIGKKRKEEN